MEHLKGSVSAALSSRTQPGAGRGAQAGRPSPPAAFRCLVLALLAASTFAAFAGVLRNGWIVIDDSGYVYDNPVVARGLTLQGVLWFLHEPHGSNWVPVTACSHMLDVQLFGLDPSGHHATSLLLHILNALLVAIVLHRLTGAWWRSVLVAAFFALHPLRVESVAWIAERKDVLSTFFCLLTLLAYGRWVARPGAGRFALVFAGLALGLMSKAMVITLPFLLVLLDAWPLGRLAGVRRIAPAGTGAQAPPRKAVAGSAPARPLGGLIVEKWPLFALVAVVSVVAFATQRSCGALIELETLSFGRRVGNALISYWRYVGMILWPHDLSVFYPHGGRADVVGAVASAAGLVAVTLAVLRSARRFPYLAVGWLWFIGTLAPVIGLIQTGAHAYADRFTYIPCIGLLIAGVWGGADLVAGSRAGRLVAAVAAVGALAGLAAATIHQVAFWKDPTALCTRVLAVSGDNPMARRVANRWLGQSLYASGQTALAAPHLEKSLGLAPGCEDSLRRLLASRPDDTETRRALAATLTRETRVEDGIREYNEILARSPDDLDALNNVAWIRATHEQARHRNGVEAVRLARHACDASPEPVAVLYSTLAAAYAEDGRFPEAIRACRRAIELATAARQPREVARYARQLRDYQSGRPFHFKG